MVLHADRPAWAKFTISGVGATAAVCCTHPVDLIKVRLQLAGQSGQKLGILQAVSNVVKNEGFPSLYKGLSAAMLRQLVYSSIRFGIYEDLKIRFADSTGAVSKPKMVLAAGLGGAIGSIAGCPADVSLVRMMADGRLPPAERRNYTNVFNVRMMADGRLPPAERRNYTNVFNAMRRIAGEEGLAALWKGVGPTTNRAILVTIGQAVPYDIFKSLLSTRFSMPDGLSLHFSASLLAGATAAVMTSPVDVVKTRMQTQKGTEYKNAVDCAVKVLKKEGPLGFYRGLIPTFLRLGPHTVLTFVFIEQVKKAFTYFDM